MNLRQTNVVKDQEKSIWFVVEIESFVVEILIKFTPG